MATMRWTDEQLAAINAYGEPVIVSAAAGSGKTAVLVERTIRLLADSSKNIPADRILAVTFTNDAASQMRRKLTDALEDFALNNPDDQWLLRQQSLLRLAEITTINAFCYGLLKDNISSTDFQSGVRILEQNEADMITERALTAVLEEEYINNPQGMNELISLFCHENDSALRKIVLKLNAFLRSLPFKHSWIANTLSSLHDGSQANKVKAYFMQRAKENAELMLSIADRIEECCEGMEYHKNAVKSYMDRVGYARSLAEAVNSLEWNDLSDLFNNLNWGTVTTTQTKEEKANSSIAEKAFCEAAKRSYDSLKKAAAEISDCLKFSESAISDDSLLVADAFEKLCLLANKLDESVHKIKVEKNAVDFADTELIAVSLLASCDENGNVTRTPLAEEIISSERYKLIVIDEFQDVNNLQDVIFKIISNTDDLSMIGSNMFAVGDAKQSIYRFRLSNPKVFMNTRLDGKNPDTPVRELLLTKNFRSRKNVLDFANYIFSSLMNLDFGETEYTHEEELVLGADYSGSDAKTKILLINSEDFDDEESGVVDNEYSCIARTIKKMILDGVTVKDGDSVRPCRPSDFCVLTRTNIQDSSLSDSFAECGLKILTTDQSGYLKSREISVLLNLLSVINSPMHDLPLASVMLSPLMGFNDDEITLIKLVDKESRLYKNILAVVDGSVQADPLLKSKCEKAVELIKRLRVYAAGMPLTRLIKKVYDVTDMFSIAAQYEDGEQKCANLYLLLEYAQSFEASSNEGIAGFLRFIDYISSTGGDFEQAFTVTESDDCVNIKTIHKSKGLEYPFVFVCQLGRKVDKRDSYGRLHLNFEHGVGLEFLDYKSLSKRKTAFSEYISLRNEQEMLSEELRLLYVAATRAKEELFIVLSDADKIAEKYASSLTSQKVPAALSSKAKCAADWLVMALLKHPEFDALRENLGDNTFVDDSPNVPSISVERFALTKLDIDKDEVVEAGKPIADLVERLKANYNYEYDKRFTDNEAKLSVSELVSDDPVSFFPKVTRLDDSLEELSAAEKGTVTHRFMQFADFESAKNDLDSEIQRLTSLGLFTQKEADAINKGAVKGFFESDMYSRLSRSENIMREKQFMVRFSDISLEEELEKIYNGTDGMLQGIADCLFEEADGFVLVDYKTDRVRSRDELIQRYSAQLTLYKAAFDALLDKPVKSAYIYSFVLKEGIEVTLK